MANHFESRRDEVYWKVLSTALELDYKRGHLKWTMSDLARRSGITRSLIYYRFGQSKSAILEEAIRAAGEEIIGVSPKQMELWGKGDLISSIRLTRAMAQRAPYLANFYLTHRDRNTEIGNMLRNIEVEYFKKIEVFFPELPEAGRKTLFVLFFGLIFSPHVDDSVLEFTSRWIQGFMGKAKVSELPEVGVLK